MEEMEKTLEENQEYGLSEIYDQEPDQPLEKGGTDMLIGAGIGAGAAGLLGIGIWLWNRHKQKKAKKEAAAKEQIEEDDYPDPGETPEEGPEEEPQKKG